VKIKIALFTLIAFFFIGCGSFQSIDTFTQDYIDISKSLNTLADEIIKDWPIIASILMGAIPPDRMPPWMVNELAKTMSWYASPKGGYDYDKKLDKAKKGYILGLKSKIAVTLGRDLIKEYVPVLLTIFI